MFRRQRGNSCGVVKGQSIAKNIYCIGVLGCGRGKGDVEFFRRGRLAKAALSCKLRRRGLRGVKLVVSDNHEGIKAVVSNVLTAGWQRDQFRDPGGWSRVDDCKSPPCC
jgi:hypothetical protein